MSVNDFSDTEKYFMKLSGKNWKFPYDCKELGKMVIVWYGQDSDGFPFITVQDREDKRLIRNCHSGRKVEESFEFQKEIVEEILKMEFVEKEWLISMGFQTAEEYARDIFPEPPRGIGTLDW